MRAALCATLTLASLSPAWAASPVQEAQQAALERARAQIAAEVQLSAYDLVDELVYGWSQSPVFATPTPVVLAGVTVPVGLGTGMEALLENHIAAVLLENPTTHIQLSHCPSCSAVVVRSGPENTVVSRGVDDPTVLAELAETGQYALFIDVEAEGTWLVLRARVTELSPDLPVVWSHTLSTSASTPALLRESTHLTSAEEAREDYLNVLRSRGNLSIPLRVGVRTYASGYQGTPPPPFLWLQSGVEFGVTEARAWTSSLIVGYSFIPQAYQGLMAEARVSRLLTGRARSLTRPDLYGFVGGAVMQVWGPATVAFTNDLVTADEVVVALEGDTPRASFGTLELGLDLRVGQRMGVSTFIETMPAFQYSENIGEYVYLMGASFQGFGTEVTFWF